MGGVAVIARAAGHTVTGCDANVYPPMSTQLEAEGIRLIEGYEPHQVELKPDVFVIGNVVSRGNPLMEEILNRGLPYVSGPQWLAENALRNKWVLAVAGTHGKTTTSSMLAWILDDAGLNPGFLIGGVPRNFGVSARLSREPYFVIEADEYDTAFFDKRSKFVHYRARTAVLNNLEFDHADIFPDLDAIETQFHHFVRTLPGEGRIVVNGRDPALARVLARGCWTPHESFGGRGGWEAVQRGEGVEIRFMGAPQGMLHWDLLGEHNLMNGLAAIAGARHAGVAPNSAIGSLGRFQNVRRRMEVRGTVNGITVYDDFAHHPTAIRTTISGLRGRVDGDRVLAVLEPRSNTMKLGVWKQDLAASLTEADLVFCFTANLGWDAASALGPLGEKLALLDNLDELVRRIARAARPGDHVLVMSNGGFGGIHEKLLRALASRDF